MALYGPESFCGIGQGFDECDAKKWKGTVEETIQAEHIKNITIQDALE